LPLNVAGGGNSPETFDPAGFLVSKRLFSRGVMQRACHPPQTCKNRLIQPNATCRLRRFLRNLNRTAQRFLRRIGWAKVAAGRMSLGSEHTLKEVNAAVASTQKSVTALRG
jgi:hypothetical protein